jgi:hypothetical protein
MEYRPVPVNMSLKQTKMLVHGWGGTCQVIPTFRVNNLYNQLNLRHSESIDYAFVQLSSICFLWMA